MKFGEGRNTGYVSPPEKEALVGEERMDERETIEHLMGGAMDILNNNYNPILVKKTKLLLERYGDHEEIPIFEIENLGVELDLPEPLMVKSIAKVLEEKGKAIH